MKKISNLVLLFTIIFFVSCSSDDGEDTILEPGANSTGNMYASIQGVDFAASKVKAYKQTNYTYIEGAQDISSKSGTYSKVTIRITVQDLKQPMLFGIGENGNGLIYYAHSTLTYTLKSGNPSLEYKGEYVENLSLLEITELTEKKISGTFGFRAVNNNTATTNLNVEEGRFSITF
ncbi:MAG: hypothetical protein A2068_08270 [Ignavibacteria bacterium GWB2_35_6b]|nr:MAG: hypothetical protein A2068_08270 [Ignavibacteria bacterium GWB2_35_6b]